MNFWEERQQSGEKKTGEEWCEIDKELYEVLDPDGWDRTGERTGDVHADYEYDFHERKRTYREHLRCVYISTCVWHRKGIDALP